MLTFKNSTKKTHLPKCIAENQRKTNQGKTKQKKVKAKSQIQATKTKTSNLQKSKSLCLQKTNQFRHKSEAPKKPINCFIFYCNERREHYKHSNLSLTETTAVIGKEWRAMTMESKAKYFVLEKKDKERYTREMKAYKKKQ